MIMACDLRVKVPCRIIDVCVKTELDTSEAFAQVTLLPDSQQKSGVVFNIVKRAIGLLSGCRHILIDKLSYPLITKSRLSSLPSTTFGSPQVF